MRYLTPILAALLVSALAAPTAWASNRKRQGDGIDNTMTAEELSRRRGGGYNTLTQEDLRRRDTSQNARELNLQHNAQLDITYSAEALERFRRYQGRPLSWRDLRLRNVVPRAFGYNAFSAEELSRRRKDNTHTAEELEALAW